MVLWGLAWPVGRLLALDLPPISIAAIRYAIVVPVFFLVLWLKEHSIGIPRAWTLSLLVMGLLNTTLYQAFFLFGVRYAAASDDSLVIGIGTRPHRHTGSVRTQRNINQVENNRPNHR